MLLQFVVTVRREVEEEIECTMRAASEEEAIADIRELVDNPHTGDVRAVRYHVARRHYHPAQDIEITPVEYEERA